MRAELRPLPWVASTLYLAVLATGLYFDLAGLAALGSRVAFAGVLLVLLALETAEPRLGGGRGTAIALLAVRMALFEAVVALDGAGLARALYLLVPFFAYFTFGRWVSVSLAAGYLAVAVLRVGLAPDGFGDRETVSDLLMFFIGLLFAVSMAAVAAEQQRARGALADLLAEVRRANRRLADHADRVADLATATERNRLARDIHDSLGHHLTAIAVLLEKAEVYRVRDDAVADAAVGDARRSTAQALREVRESVDTLRADAGPFSLAAAVTSLAERLDDEGFRVTVHLTGDDTGYPRTTLLALYRAAQEGLTNARRHADAATVRVTIALGPDAATAEVADDGRGGDTRRDPHRATSPAGHPPGRAGTGLDGLRERLGLIGGSLEVDSVSGAGTRLRATVPRTADPATLDPDTLDPARLVPGRP